MRWIALFGVVLGCGGGGTKKPAEEPVVAGNVAPPDAAPVAEPVFDLARATITGAFECDELVLLQRCIAKNSTDMQAVADEMLVLYREGLSSESSRSAMIAACTEYLPSMRDAGRGFGCESATGAIECDVLIELSRCIAKDVPDAAKAVEDTVVMYRDALAVEAARQATIDACMMSVESLRDAAIAVGCL